MNLQDLINESKGKIINQNLSVPTSFHNIVTDTRILEPGDIFVALKGNKQDGHRYIKDAIKKGCICIFISEEVFSESVLTVKVEDTKECLLDFARVYLKKYKPKIIAITGSNGKSTTKEMIATMLEQKYKIIKSIGNKNNHIGLPETIFKLNSSIEYLIVELGMNHEHEIEKYSNLLHPDIAVITNIGTAHIGNLKSKKNILKAKMEIVSGMKDKVVFINGKDEYLVKKAKSKDNEIRKVDFSNSKIQIEVLEQTIFGSLLLLKKDSQVATVFLKQPGSAVIEDLLLALTVALSCSISFEQIIDAINHYEPLKQRMEIVYWDRKMIIMNDCYNASLESLEMDIGLLEPIPIHKIFILGDFLELGKKSKKIHKKIGRLLSKLSDTDICFIGKEMYEAYQKCKGAKYFVNKQVFMKEYQKEEGIILLKGSRKMKLEELISYLKP